MELKTEFDLHKVVYFFKEKINDVGALYIAEGTISYIDLHIEDGQWRIIYTIHGHGRKFIIKEENLFNTQRNAMIEFNKNLDLFLGDPKKYVRRVDDDVDDELPF